MTIIISDAHIPFAVLNIRKSEPPDASPHLPRPGAATKEMLMTMPSREFLVRQAVLNGLQKCWPNTFKMHGAAETIRVMGCHAHELFVSASLEPYIRAEYRKLVEKHGEVQS